MANEIFTRKMDLLFTSLDMTHDGVIDRSDGDSDTYEVAGEAAATSAEADFRVVAERFWMVFAKLGPDGTYRIDQNHFRSAMERYMLHDEGFDLVIGPVAERWFGVYDADHDGHITFEEYARWLAFRHAEPDDLRQGFDRLDRNGDGLVSRQEWTAALKEYCTSDDAESAGNFLMGPLG